MANTIDVAFIKQFESEVHMAYQRMGSKLRNTVRTVGNVAGSTVRFQKIGTGSASTKSRNGDITAMELTHTQVEATMADHYAAEYIDKLDELKTNIGERQAVAQSAAADLGRKTNVYPSPSYILNPYHALFAVSSPRVHCGSGGPSSRSSHGAVPVQMILGRAVPS